MCAPLQKMKTGDVSVRSPQGGPLDPFDRSIEVSEEAFEAGP